MNKYENNLTRKTEFFRYFRQPKSLLNNTRFPSFGTSQCFRVIQQSQSQNNIMS